MHTNNSTLISTATSHICHCSSRYLETDFGLFSMF